MSHEKSDTEEEILVYAEFEDMNIGHYRSIHVLGVNERNPIIQMDDSFFTGKFENPLGTYMFFEEDSAPQTADPVLDKLPEKNLKYLFKTRKLLKMENAYVTPKEGTDQELPSQASQKEDQIEVVNFKTIAEALETFKNDIECKTNDKIMKDETASLPENHSSTKDVM